jgi:AcrR family transcriptional regulator
MGIETPPEAAAPSRRELNKTATRSAIVEAAFDLLRSGGPEAVTADRVADAAGISRRTLFNYFPTVESALNVPTETFLDHALRQFDGAAPSVPVMSAAVDAMRSLADRSLLAPVAELFVLSRNNPQLGRQQLEAWDNCANRLMETISSRVPGHNALEITVFANSIVGAGKAAFGYWALTHAGDLSDSSLTALQNNLTDALAQLRDGFPSLHTTAAPATTREA